MNEQTGTPERDTTLASAWSSVWPRSRTSAAGACRTAFKDVVAGATSSIVLIGGIVSVGALMFPAGLEAGIPAAVWAMLIGSCIAGLIVALTTSLAPIATGIDSPAAAVLVLLSATIGPSVLASTGSPATAIEAVMLVFTAVTVTAGAVQFGIGVAGWGTYCRFIPYFVVAGFLAATGWLLIVQAVHTATGLTASSSLVPPGWTGAATAKLGACAAVLLVLVIVRRWSRSALAMPLALLAMWLAGAAALRGLGLAGPRDGWYLASLGALTPWVPLDALRTARLSWPIVIDSLPQLVAGAIVALISLVTKVSSVEVMRKTSGDLDREFRANGLGNVVAAAFGGIVASMQPGSSRLLRQAGGVTRMSGAAGALVLGIVAIAQFDLPGVIPVPVLAGLVLYLGSSFLVDALARPLAQRAWRELALTAAIMLVCIRYGFVIGVLAGVIAACIRFALSCARLGVVRQHATRELFASNVDRSPLEAAYLRDHGATIHLYWLSGYIFFGSSESLFERIRGDLASSRVAGARYVILDFAQVFGTDASAVVSLTKLRDLCDAKAATLVYCALSTRTHAALRRAGLFGRSRRHRAFADLNAGLAWCEDRLIAEGGIAPARDLAAFETWLQQQLGERIDARDLMPYLERREIAASQVVYREGEPADSVDLVAAGDLAVDVGVAGGGRLRLRRITTHTMLGEMGFVRRSVRSATVSANGPATLFTLTRANMERLRVEHPGVAHAFDDFMLRTLADRMDTANRAIAALAG